MRAISSRFSIVFGTIKEPITMSCSECCPLERAIWQKEIIHMNMLQWWNSEYKPIIVINRSNFSSHFLLSPSSLSLSISLSSNPSFPFFFPSFILFLPTYLLSSSLHVFLGQIYANLWCINVASVKSVHAMWKMHVVQSYDNDILEELAITNPLPKS
jgi:hypothetical protein